MRRAVALPLFVLVVLGLEVAGSGPARPEQVLSAGAVPHAAPVALAGGRTVYLVGGLSEESLLTLTAAGAASSRPDVVLLDTSVTRPFLKSYLAAFRPDRVVPVGSFTESIAELERSLGVRTAPGLKWERGPPVALWQDFFPQAERVVVCPAGPRGLLLQAACLAGVLQAPLAVTRGEAGEAADLAGPLARWRTRQVFAVGAAARVCRDLHDVQVTELDDEDAVAMCCLEHQAAKGPVRTLVVANPSDIREGLGGMSTLAPWIALRRRAALLLTDERGSNVADIVRAALAKPALAQADYLILAGNLKALPMERRPNPARGEDPFVEAEPLTPRSDEPCTFATGRLFHDDRAVVPLTLARQQLLVEAGPPRKVLLVSNTGGSLPLLETFSRHTARELRNAGYQTTAFFGAKTDKDEVRRLLPGQDLFLWEGHHRTLIDEYGIAQWRTPLRPSLVFLQSCLTLDEKEVQPLQRCGAVAIIGSSARTYSSSGGACSLAFFDALLYDDQSLGGSLRQAKNFLLCYSELKKRRLGEKAKLPGAGVRSAWAFTLWGDPLLKLPAPEPPADALDPVRHRVERRTIVLSVPDQGYEGMASARYRSQTWPNARLAGLIREGEGDTRELVPFLFAEVALPDGPPGQAPRLRTRLPGTRWTFRWDGRRRCGSLLAMPRPGKDEELRFRVEWGD